MVKQKKNIIIEITRMSTQQGQSFKLGQCLIQKNLWPKSKHFFICKKALLRKNTLEAFKKLKIRIINTDFENYWEKEGVKYALIQAFDVNN